MNSVDRYHLENLQRKKERLFSEKELAEVEDARAGKRRASYTVRLLEYQLIDLQKKITKLEAKASAGNIKKRNQVLELNRRQKAFNDSNSMLSSMNERAEHMRKGVIPYSITDLNELNREIGKERTRNATLQRALRNHIEICSFPEEIIDSTAPFELNTPTREEMDVLRDKKIAEMNARENKKAITPAMKTTDVSSIFKNATVSNSYGEGIRSIALEEDPNDVPFSI